MSKSPSLCECDAKIEANLIQKSFCFSGKARIRVQMSAAHSTADVNKCVDAFIDVGRSLNVIS